MGKVMDAVMEKFGYVPKEPEPEVVDENGKVVNKKTIGQKIWTGVKTVVSLGAGVGAGYVIWKTSEGQTEKRLQPKIDNLDRENKELWNRIDAMTAAESEPETEEVEEPF